jgi:hypothetical protein
MPERIMFNTAATTSDESTTTTSTTGSSTNSNNYYFTIGTILESSCCDEWTKYQNRRDVDQN